VRAAQRHTSHVCPSAAVTRPATVSKPDGATPGGGVVAVVLVSGVAVVSGAPAGPSAAAVTATDVEGVDGDVVDDDAPSLLHAAPTTSSAAAADRHTIGVTVGVSVGDVPATCDSCGASEDELFAVRRQYVTPPEWDVPAREVTLDEVEHWCFSCCTHYPHVEA